MYLLLYELADRFISSLNKEPMPLNHDQVTRSHPEFSPPSTTRICTSSLSRMKGSKARYVRPFVQFFIMWDR